MSSEVDAILLVSFGGPEGPDDVMPFLRNVVHGKNVPDDRLSVVAQHYLQFGGISPINEENRGLLAALRTELENHRIQLPIYWGNRNWHPFLEETVKQMAADGVKRALAFVTSAYSSYSSCRQYREDIERARDLVGAGAPTIEKLPVFFSHPEFLQANADRLREAIGLLNCPMDETFLALFSAHSIPLSMADNCRYLDQLNYVAEAVAAQVKVENWQLVFQSRSGSPHQPWLEPDINEHLRSLPARGIKDVVILPIGFICDHMEVKFDLDVAAARTCAELGIRMVRGKTVGIHAKFVSMVRNLIENALNDRAVSFSALDEHLCGSSCCLYTRTS